MWTEDWLEGEFCCKDSVDEDERGGWGGGGGICSTDDDLRDSAEGEMEPLYNGTEPSL